MACILAMFSGTGIMVGLFGPLLPSMLKHEWISKSQAGYISAAASIGLFIGAFASTAIARRRSLGFSARLFLLIGLASLGLSAIDYGPIWLGALRFLSGVSTAASSIAITSLITQGVRGSARGALIGLVGFGSGFGLIIISILLPMPFVDLVSSPANGWILATILTAVCIMIAWPGLHSRAGAPEFPKLKHAHSHHRKQLILLSVCYGLITFASAPFYIYFAAYISDLFKVPAESSSAYYAVIGIGMTIGGITCDYLLVRIFGRYVSFVLAIAIGLASTVAIILSSTLWVCLAASLLMAISFSGTSALKTYNVLEIAGPAAEAIWLKIMKIVTSITFTLGAFISGALMSIGLDYGELFTIVAITFAVSLIISIFMKLPVPVTVHVHDTTE